MMIKIISVGKIKNKELIKLIEKYEKMIPRKIEKIEIKDQPTIDKINIEGDKILKQIKREDFVVTLEIEGNNLSSEEFADFIKNYEINKEKHLVFIIGGSFGLDMQVKKRSNYQISFSKMTFPHQLMQLILMEQIYRAYMININHPYHK
ncbi:MAG TPA: 23S rRNA (pseudouridine(1915)-N(3))-methyltransferase RlmH [Acholeplasma sp.]|nr:23S rRNA (pseudouridine(1915)-N(3))-methyltransferase RlmH [Acholeplasma sp.]